MKTTCKGNVKNKRKKMKITDEYLRSNFEQWGTLTNSETVVMRDLDVWGCQ